MTLKRFSSALAAVALLLCAGTAGAADATAKPAPANAAAPQASSATHKPVVKGKLVDINSANKAALMKLPGISDALADKIIAGRPYGSKTWLLSYSVIDGAAYDSIKARIEAKQPFKTAAENVAYFEKMKKQKAAKP